MNGEKSIEKFIFGLAFGACLFRVVASPRDVGCWAPILGMILVLALYYARAFIPGTPEKLELEAIKKELLEVKGNVQTLSVKVGLSR